MVKGNNVIYAGISHLFRACAKGTLILNSLIHYCAKPLFLTPSPPSQPSSSTSHTPPCRSLLAAGRGSADIRTRRCGGCGLCPVLS